MVKDKNDFRKYHEADLPLPKNAAMILLASALLCLLHALRFDVNRFAFAAVGAVDLLCGYYSYRRSIGGTKRKPLNDATSKYTDIEAWTHESSSVLLAHFGGFAVMMCVVFLLIIIGRKPIWSGGIYVAVNTAAALLTALSIGARRNRCIFISSGKVISVSILGKVRVCPEGSVCRLAHDRASRVRALDSKGRTLFAYSTRMRNSRAFTQRLTESTHRSAR